ncbi:cupin domain-containing protein [Aquimarina agarilytica]|uniref:cupin domain-containing protein n=1 Tax=Aquimarina agarilytica TaxID=1087449 RepID=UPI0002897EA1|nr:cupin domain-containing protein [Aquimarina agarilytica]
MELYNPINKESIHIVKSAKDCGENEGIEIEVTLAPKGGNPIHFHTKFTEHFYALKGVLGLHFDGTEIQLNPAEDFAVRPTINHRFYNPSKTDVIKFKVIITPPIESFEWFLKAQFGLVNDAKVFSSLQVPKNPLHLLVLLQWGDTQSNTLLYQLGKPFLKLGYQFAKSLGVEQKLKDRYC